MTHPLIQWQVSFGLSQVSAVISTNIHGGQRCFLLVALGAALQLIIMAFVNLCNFWRTSLLTLRLFLDLEDFGAFDGVWFEFKHEVVAKSL